MHEDAVACRHEDRTSNDNADSLYLFSAQSSTPAADWTAGRRLATLTS